MIKNRQNGLKIPQNITWNTFDSSVVKLKINLKNKNTYHYEPY